MFILDPDPTFKLKVSLFRPGTSTPQSITLVARHKTQDELIEWTKRVNPADGDGAFLLEVVAGWEGVADRDRKPVEFSEDGFRALINNFPGAGLLIFKAYAEELNAGRLKN